MDEKFLKFAYSPTHLASDLQAQKTLILPQFCLVSNGGRLVTKFEKGGAWQDADWNGHHCMPGKMSCDSHKQMDSTK